MKRTNRARISILVMVFAILLVGCYQGAAETWESWNLAYSDSVVLGFTEHNPVQIKLTGGANFDYRALLVTENQKIKAYLTGQGFDISQTVLVNRSELRAELAGNSELQSLFTSADNLVEFSAAGEGSVAFMWDLGNLPHDSKNVQVRIQASGEEGLLKANIGGPEVSPLSDEEIVSRTLKVTIGQARNLLEEKGSRLLNAIDQLRQTGTRNGVSVMNGSGPAGGGGAIIEGEGGAIDINSMDPSSVFQVYFDNPKYKGNLQDSKLQVQLLHEATNTPIKGVGVTITVAGPIEGPNPDQIVLMDEIKFDETKGYYFYQFDPESWLIDHRKLQPGGYDLHIDFERLQHATLGITVTKDKKVFYGRY